MLGDEITRNDQEESPKSSLAKSYNELVDEIAKRELAGIHANEQLLICLDNIMKSIRSEDIANSIKKQKNNSETNEFDEITRESQNNSR